MMKYSNIKQRTTCSGKDCSKPGKHYLKIIIIKKSGWFCDHCKKELELNSLILNETSFSLGIGESEILRLHEGGNSVKEVLKEGY